MKKFLRGSLTAIMLTLAIGTISNAKFQYLWKISSSTFVSNEHKPGWHDKYYGTAAVRGTDRGFTKNGHTAYYKWTKITYNVQGKRTYVATAYSGGKDDYNTIVKEVTAKDIWNNGPKTTAKYNYDTGVVKWNKQGPIPTRLNNGSNK